MKQRRAPAIGVLVGASLLLQATHVVADPEVRSGGTPPAPSPPAASKGAPDQEARSDGTNHDSARRKDTRHGDTGRRGAGPPSAQGKSNRAEAAFKEGRKHLAAGRLGPACAAFRESQRLAPAVGTLLNLARCQERKGALGTARRLYEQAAEMAEKQGDEQRASFARTQAERLPPLAEQPSPGSGAADAENGRAASGHSSSGSDGTSLSTTTTPLSSTNYSSPSQATVSTTASFTPLPSPPPTPSPGEETSFTAWRWAGLTTALVGAAATTAGLVMVLNAHAKADGADCDANLDCTEEGFRERSEAINDLATARVVSITGGVVTAAGVGLFLLAPPAALGGATASSRRASTFVALRGRF